MDKPIHTTRVYHPSGLKLLILLECPRGCRPTRISGRL